MDDSSRGALTAAGLSCGACGTELPPNSKFCNECGTPVAPATQSAEYKQVTVLFADVVHSMDIAAAVGPERLREILTELTDRCAAVVRRYGGTVDKFTGDGIINRADACFGRKPRGASPAAYNGGVDGGGHSVAGHLTDKSGLVGALDERSGGDKRPLNAFPARAAYAGGAKRTAFS